MSERDTQLGEFGNSVVRKVDTTGKITTVAGTPGSSIDGGSGGLAALQTPLEPDGLAVDTAGNLHIADGINSRVLQVSARTGVASVVAGMTGDRRVHRRWAGDEYPSQLPHGSHAGQRWEPVHR